MPVKFQKVKNYPRPHQMEHSWMHGLETAVANEYTIYPIAMYDEGLGAPSAYEANPENSAFVEAAAPNCFINSRIDFIISEFIFSLTKAALETDGLHAVKCCFMPITMSFKEDYIAIDELSSLEVQDVLEMQTEATDRQGFPLYNDVKMVERVANSALLAATMPGLTTTQVLEGVAFSQNQYYDMLQYMTNSAKLRGAQRGLKWFTLTRDRPVHMVKIKLSSKNKAMNQFNFFGVLTGVPGVGNFSQIPVAGDTTNVNHVSVQVRTRYNEWQQGFNMEQV